MENMCLRKWAHLHTFLIMFTLVVMAFCASAAAQVVNPTIAPLNGNRFLGRYNGQSVTNVSRQVTAKLCNHLRRSIELQISTQAC